ncbi:MAG: hypothetical protein U0451_00770 [Candidatus Saccharimonadales bacterium]
MENPEVVSGIDVLRLFSEDLANADRISLFRQAAEQLRGDIKELTTRKNVNLINKNYAIHTVFNRHANSIDAGQSIRETEDPFITFVEGAEATDIHQDVQFSQSVRNSFEMRFNNAGPELPSFQLTPDNEFGYWEYRGLLAKSSIVAPIDIRYYAARMLDALIGDRYSQDYLSQRIGIQAFDEFSSEELVERALNKGKLIMHSNAVRELTSVKQIMETLLVLEDPDVLDDKFSPEISKKITAIKEDAKKSNEKLPVYVFYGTEHHGFSHELTTRKINVTRSFPGSVEYPRQYKYTGNATSPFFNGHHFDLSDEQLNNHARAYVLESLLLLPMIMQSYYGLVLPTNNSQEQRNTWAKISLIARNKQLQEDLPNLVDSFRNDKSVPVQILGQFGIKLHSIAE